MTTDQTTVQTADQITTAESETGLMRYIVPTVLAVFLTLLALAPVGFVLYRNLPPRVATVDLQLLVEEDQKRMIDVLGNGGNVTDEQRAIAQRLTVDFAKKLSETIDSLGLECGCVIVNKAALLGGVTIDYTDEIRARMKR